MDLFCSQRTPTCLVNADSMMGQRGSGGPALNQYWLNTSCLLVWLWSQSQAIRLLEDLDQHFRDYRVYPANTKHSICTTSAHRLRCWSSIVQMLCKCFVFSGNKHTALCGFPANTTRWSNVGLMLAQRRRRWASISPALDQRVLLAGLRWLHAL